MSHVIGEVAGITVATCGAGADGIDREPAHMVQITTAGDIVQLSEMDALRLIELVALAYREVHDLNYPTGQVLDWKVDPDD